MEKQEGYVRRHVEMTAQSDELVHLDKYLQLTGVGVMAEDRVLSKERKKSGMRRNFLLSWARCAIILCVVTTGFSYNASFFERILLTWHFYVVLNFVQK